MPTLQGEGSIIVMDTIGVPLYSAREIVQTLTPIPAASVVRRTINGTGRNIAQPAMRKYNSEIQAGSNNTQPPSFDEVWPGQEVVIDCVVELNRPTVQAAGRTVVPGSEVVIGSFTRYRPRITFLVVSLSCAKEEWQAGTPWSMTLTEK